MTVRIHLQLAEEARLPAADRISDLLERAARAALRTAVESLTGEVEVSFVAEPVIRELNRRFLGSEESTDVIAFDLGEGAHLVGDVYIAPEVAARSAAELGISEEEELVRLVVHGVLHLVGHEHPEGEDRYTSPMFRLQEQLVRRLTGTGLVSHRPRADRRGPTSRGNG